MDIKTIISLALVLTQGVYDFYDQILGTSRSVLEITSTENPAPLGDEVTLMCNSDVLRTDFTATWLYDGMLIFEESDMRIVGTSLIISGFQVNRAGIYTCLNGDIISPEYNLKFMIPQPTIRVNMAVPVLLGDDFMLTCVTQALSVSFIWMRDKITLEETGNLLSGEMLPSDAGQYDCAVVTSGEQSKLSDTVGIDFKVPQPTVVPADTSIDHPTFPIGVNVRLQCQSSFISKTIVPKIFWFKDSSIISDSSKYKINDDLLVIDDFEQSDAGLISCLEEIEGRQSERSHNLAIRFSDPHKNGDHEIMTHISIHQLHGQKIDRFCVYLVPEITIHLSDKVYNSSTLEPIMLGTHFVAECEQDIDTLTKDFVVWSSDLWGRRVETMISVNAVMDLSTAGSYNCVIKYDGDNGMSASSQPITLEYAVPKPEVIPSTGRTALMFGEYFELKCETQHDVGNGMANRRILWYYNGTELNSTPKPFVVLDGHTLMHSNFEQDAAGSYQCVDEIGGTASEKSDELVMQAIVPHIVMTSANGMSTANLSSPVPLPADSIFTLECFEETFVPTTVGHPLHARFYWQKDDVFIFEESSVFSGLGGPAGTSSIYTCSKEVKGQASRVESAVSSAFVVSMELPSPNVVASNSTTFVLGSEVRLVCSNPTIDDRTISNSIWYKNGQQIIFQVDDNIIFSKKAITFKVYRETDPAIYACLNIVEGGRQQSGMSGEFTAVYTVPRPTVTSKEDSASIGAMIKLVCQSSLPEPAINSKIDWFKNDDLLAPGSDYDADGFYLVINNAQADQAGAYSCTESVGEINSDHSDIFTLTMLVPIPEIRPEDPDILVFLGDYFKLFCGSQVPIERVEWRRGDETMLWSNLNLTSVMTTDDVGDYTCRVGVGLFWSEWSHGRNVNFKVPTPEIIPDDPDLVTVLGDEFKLYCYTDVEFNQVEWKKDRTTLFYQNQTYSKVMTPDLDGRYTCRIAVNSISSDWSPERIVTLKVPTPEILPDGPDLVTFLGDEFKLYCHTHGEFNQVEWKKDNITLSYQNQTYEKVMTPDLAGKYTCRFAINSIWSDYSPELNARFEVPTPEISPDGPDLVTVLGGEFELRCRTHDEFNQVEWKRDNTTLSYQNQTYEKVMTPDLAGKYACRIAVNYIWSDWSPELNVTFGVPKPKIFTNETAVLLGDSMTLTCVSNYENDDVTQREYRWNKHTQEIKTTDSDFVINGNVLLVRTARTGYTKRNIKCTEIVAGISSKERKFSLTFLVPRPQLVATDTNVTLNQAVELKCFRGYDHYEKHSKIHWFKEDENLDIDHTTIYYNGTSLHIVSFRFEDEGHYQCLEKVRQRYSERSEVVFLRAVVPPPTIQVSHESKIKTTSHAVMLGSQIQVRCWTELNVDADFIWKKNGLTLSGQNDSVLHKGQLDMDVADSYMCKVYVPTLEKNSDWSQELVLDFRVPRPTLHYNITTVVLGDPFFVSCSSGYQKDHTSSFTWYRDEVLEMSDSDILAIEFFLPSDAGVYMCQEKIENKSSAKSSGVDISYEVPVPTLQSNPATVRIGETVQLTCQSNFNSPSIPVSSEFVWVFNDTQFLDHNSSVLELTHFHPNWTGPFQCSEQVGDVMSDWSDQLYVRFQEHNDSELPSQSQVRPVMNSTSQSTVPEKSTIRLRCHYKNDTYTHRFYWYRDHRLLPDMNKSSVVIKGFTASFDGNYSCGVLFDGGIMHSQSFNLKTVDAHALCTCPCSDFSKTVVMNETEIEEVVSSIKKNLTVDTTTLSSKVRAKTSAPDSRPASVSVGSVAVALLIVVPIIIVSFDCINLCSFISKRMEYKT